MKSETSDEKPAIDFSQFKNIRGQVHAKEITHVLLNDGQWYPIEAGSFHLYKTGDGVPFAQFDIHGTVGHDKNFLHGHKRVEVFPATVAGWAYDVPEEK